MAYIVKYIFNMAVEAYADSDPRVENLPLAGSLLPVCGIIIAYLVFVLSWGPKWMENRAPYDLKYARLVYNAVQVVCNVSLLFLGIRYTLFEGSYDLTCSPMDYNNREPWMLVLVKATYGYYLTKYLDLFDTVFFILRKKNSHITFLHVYHHAGMIAAVYVHTKYLSGSHPTVLGVINLLVHTVMYAYYFLTSLKPNAATLWWKKHITQLQLFQFGFICLHFLLVFINNHCKLPLFVAFVGFIQNAFMFSMFFDFYYKTYIRKPNKKSLPADKQGELETAAALSDNHSNKCN